MQLPAQGLKNLKEEEEPKKQPVAEKVEVFDSKLWDAPLPSNPEERKKALANLLDNAVDNFLGNVVADLMVAHNDIDKNLYSDIEQINKELNKKEKKKGLDFENINALEDGDDTLQKKQISAREHRYDDLDELEDFF